MDPRITMLKLVVGVLLNVAIWPLYELFPYVLEAVKSGGFPPFPLDSILIMMMIGAGVGVFMSFVWIAEDFIASTHYKRYKSDHPGEGCVFSDMHDALILLGGDGEKVAPFHAYHIKVPRGKKKELLKWLDGGVVIPKEGKPRELYSPIFVGPWGSSFGQRLISRVCQAWVMDIEIRKSRLSFDAIKRMIAHRLEMGENKDRFFIGGDDLDGTVKKIQSARSARDIFDALGLSDDQYE